VIAAFRPGDSLRVYRLQRRGVSLDVQRRWTRPQTPLWEAWLAYLTQQAMGQPTFVMYDPHDGEAFVQIRYRPRQAAADVAYLAPSLEERGRATGAWSSLLDGACIEAAGQGIQRVFASLAESGGEIDLFQQAGFALYAGEDIYCLKQPPANQRTGQGLALRPRTPGDWPSLQRLCVAITPQRVRQAEGGINIGSEAGKACQWHVLPGKNGEDLAAAVCVCTGGPAHWLRVLVHPDARDQAEALADWGVAHLIHQAHKPVYCSVRRYESGLRETLLHSGFELSEGRALAVRHTLAWVKSPAQDLVPALSKGVEPVPPAYRINGEREFGTPNGRLATEREPS
jgi:hypothetical protein